MRSILSGVVIAASMLAIHDAHMLGWWADTAVTIIGALALLLVGAASQDATEREGE